MKAWLLKEFGLDHLQLEDVPTPVPGPAEILVKVSAVSLNYRDRAIVDGNYTSSLGTSALIPTSDAVGIVVAIGEQVTRFKTGDRVNSHYCSHWIDGRPARNEPDYCLGFPLPGALAEYMVLNEQAAVLAPATLGNAEASTLPIAALTAWRSLVEFGQIGPGSTVLVQGTGGVSIFATQFAKALGAKVIATSSSDSNLDRVKELGAFAGINYRSHPDWHERVLELTDGEGVDLTLEVAGGASLNQSMLATKVGGKIAQVGFLAGIESRVNLFALIGRQINLQGIVVGPRTSFDRMNAFLNDAPIKPVIDRIYPFEGAKDAYEHLGSGAFGKIVIEMPSKSGTS